MYDVIIVGAGPAGIFTALEMLKKGSKKKICLIEKGKSIKTRTCPKHQIGKCVHCNPCSITTGFSGAGAFSDGKLSLHHSVGGSLPELIGKEKCQRYIDYTDKIYLEFGADDRVEGVDHFEERKQIRRRAIEANLQLVDCPIRHLGTEKAHDVYLAIENYLADNGVELMFSTECEDIIIENDVCSGVVIHPLGKEDDKTILKGKDIVVAGGRRGADWLEKVCVMHEVKHRPGPVDIGVRVEVRNEVMEQLNESLYEAKLIGHPAPFKDKVRTFCQNPGGFVSQENYDDNLAVVNGHSYKDTKSENTNLSILVTHNFSEPFHEPIQYAEKVGQMVNMLGTGQILVQRFGDILDGKRTWPEELENGNLTPTLPDAVAGDITAAMPYRTMSDIIGFIKAMDHVAPGFASDETLLYSPELKFYSNKVAMDEDLNTSIPHLYCLGDSSGWTRGLMMASVMGVLCGEKLCDEE